MVFSHFYFFQNWHPCYDLYFHLANSHYISSSSSTLIITRRKNIAFSQKLIFKFVLTNDKEMLINFFSAMNYKLNKLKKNFFAAFIISLYFHRMAHFLFIWLEGDARIRTYVQGPWLRSSVLGVHWCSPLDLRPFFSQAGNELIPR